VGNGKVDRSSTGARGRKAAGQRAGTRISATLEIEVQGRSGSYAGQTVDLSCTGALVWISDERFATGEEAQNLVAYGEKVAEELQDLRIRFAESGLVREAEVIRVVRNKAHEAAPPMVAIRFTNALREPDLARLDLDASKLLRTESGKPKRPQPARSEQDERRRATRVDRIFYAQVTGEGGSYTANILNLSHLGALITITDAALPAPSDPDQLVLFTKRLGMQFSNGMTLGILEGDVSVQADVVRVSERAQGGDVTIVIGIRFRRSLTPEECRQLEIEAQPEQPVATPENTRLVLEKTRIRDLMRQAVRSAATDLHVKVGVPPRMRMGGTLLTVGKEVVTSAEAHEMALELMNPEQAAKFEREGDFELACTLEKVGRFRINILRQRGLTGLAVRCIPDDVPSVDALGLHPLAVTLAAKPRGLVLVTGPTGSGKSTTLAALVDQVNRTRACHIITMEDPIEYLHEDKEAHITQREIGRDALDYATALKRALRQDPDVIMVGEMRDLETIALALTAAETGHLVFATLHTTSAVLTPARIIDVFPPGQQTQVRMQLADSLQGVMAQMLLPRADKPGMVLAQETLVATEAVRALIRERKIHQISNQMQIGVKEGMQTLEMALNDYIARGIISYEAAIAKAHYPKQVRRKGEKIVRK